MAAIAHELVSFPVVVGKKSWGTNPKFSPTQTIRLAVNFSELASACRVGNAMVAPLTPRKNARRFILGPSAPV